MAASGYVHRRAAYELTIDGVSITPTVRPRLMSLSLTEKRGADADTLEIVLNDADGRVEIPPAKAVITLKLGWIDLVEGATAQLVEKGRFTVDDRGHDGSPDRLTIRAKSADLTRSFRNRRSHTWENTTLGAVLQDVAGRNGLQAAVAAAKSSIAVTHLAQIRESDSAFLARLGRLHDAVATVKDRRLLFAPIGGGLSAGTGQTIPPATITRRDGDRHSWKAAERGNYSGVVVEWHDRTTGQRSEVTIGSADNAKRLGRVYGSEAAARRAGESHQSRQDRGKATFGLDLAIARPDLYPDRGVTVSGWKPEIDSSAWLIAECQHSIDAAGGMKTVLQMELGPASGSANRA